MLESPQVKQIKQDIIALRQDLQWWQNRKAQLLQQLGSVQQHIDECEEKIYKLQDLPAKLQDKIQDS